MSRSKSSSTPVGAECKAKGKCGHVRLPVSTAHDLALMQFFAGGSMESNVRMLMAARAHERGGGGVEDVFRDEKDRIWIDEDEEMEYAHLLGGDADANAEDEKSVEGEMVGIDSFELCQTVAGRSVLSVPPRQKKHLDRPRFLVDMAAFGPRTPE